MHFWVAILFFLSMVPLAEAGDFTLTNGGIQSPGIILASLDNPADVPPTPPTEFRVSLDTPKPASGSTFGLGQCHASGAGIGYAISTWSYSAGGESAWNTIEPKRGEYNWSGLDYLINKAKADKKKIWIQLLHNNPHSFAPQWAVDAGLEVVQTHYGSLPVIWGAKYHELFGGVLKAMADRYDKDDFLDVIGAVIIMGGGYYGEMAISPKCGPGMGCQLPDALDPNNPLIKSIAKAYGKTPQEVATTHSCTIEGRLMSCYTFDDFYIDSIKKTIDLYATTFKKFPVVIQLGTGLSWQARVSKDVVRYANCKYGDRVWTKFNGWEPGAASIAGNADYSRTGFEGGHINLLSRSYWRDDANKDGLRDNKNPKCPTQYTPAECEAYGLSQVKAYIDSSIYRGNNSFLCLQGAIFENPREYFFSLTCPNPDVPGFCPNELERKLKSAKVPVRPDAAYCAGIQ